MGILYESTSISGWAIWLFVVFALMAFNEFGRTTKWGGLVLFLIVPAVLTVTVWPTTAAPGNEYGTGNWFNWVKTYSALAGCLGFMAIRYIPGLSAKKWALCFPPLILALNILEACIRDFQCYGYGAFNGDVINNLWVMSGPWNIMNGIAGLLNIVTICGWLGIFVSKDRTKDMIWPDMIWPWIIAYDLWNFAYVYNCVTDRAFYSAALLISCTIPAFTIKKGAWAQHRVHTLALYMMLMMTIPNFFVDSKYAVASSHSPAAYYTVSILALAFNLGVAVYQVRTIVKGKKNPLKDDLYSDHKAYQAVKNANS